MLKSRKLKLDRPKLPEGACRGRELGMSRPQPHGRGGGAIAANGEESSMVICKCLCPSGIDELESSMCPIWVVVGRWSSVVGRGERATLGGDAQGPVRR
jgi:hypothetical protein